jgi:hypothetical protein
MSEGLGQQLAAYHRLRPDLLAQRREGWALVARERVVDVFDEFDVASAYADANFPNEDVLIRHTSEHRGIAPFIVART